MQLFAQVGGFEVALIAPAANFDWSDLAAWPTPAEAQQQYSQTADEVPPALQ